MPTYEYACTECNHHFDLRQGFDAETISECPECFQCFQKNQYF